MHRINTPAKASPYSYNGCTIHSSGCPRWLTLQRPRWSSRRVPINEPIPDVPVALAAGAPNFTFPRLRARRAPLGLAGSTGLRDVAREESVNPRLPTTSNVIAYDNKRIPSIHNSTGSIIFRASGCPAPARCAALWHCLDCRSVHHLRALHRLRAASSPARHGARAAAAGSGRIRSPPSPPSKRRGGGCSRSRGDPSDALSYAGSTGSFLFDLLPNSFRNTIATGS